MSVNLKRIVELSLSGLKADLLKYIEGERVKGRQINNKTLKV